MATMAEPGHPRLEIEGGARPTASEAGGRQFLYLSLGALLAAVLGVGSYVALTSGSYVSAVRSGDELPVIRADERPFKSRPDDPGGLQVPHRDKLVYSRLKGVSETPDVERLLPEPERPLPPPETVPVPEAAPVPAPTPAPAVAETASAASPPATPSPGEGTGGAELPPSPAAEAAAGAGERALAMVTPVARPTPPAMRPQPAPAASPVAASPAAATAVPRGPALAPPPPAAAGGGTKYLIQLGAMSSPELARAQWAKLMAANGDLLAPLQPTIARADLGERGTLYRLRAGPIEGAARAQEVCRALAGRGVGCVVVSFGG